MQTIKNPLRLTSIGRDAWHCDSGPNTYRITRKDDQYYCTCPARVECRHIKQLKLLQDIQIESQIPMQLEMPKELSSNGINPRTTQLEKLKAPFLPAEHKDRDLPGGGRWFYLPWQLIRKRINEVDPCWSVAYTDPVVAGDFVCVRCQLTVCGITREGMGNDKAYPDKKTYGTPIERAIADAFKNAAEQFGVGAYLDSQDFVVKYLQQHGDGRGYAYSEKSASARAKQGLPPRKFTPNT